MFCSAFNQLSILQSFNPEQLALLRPVFNLFFMPAGSLFFEQGEQTDYFYILVSGEVAIRYKPEDGPSLVITRLHSEGVIGWGAVIGNPYYTSSAVCVNDCTVLRLRRQTLRQFTASNPALGRAFVEKLAGLIEVRLRSNHPQLMVMLKENLSVRAGYPIPAV